MKQEKRGGFGWAAGLAVLLNPVFLVVYGFALMYLERLYRTQDGGRTCTEVELPVSGPFAKGLANGPFFLTAEKDTHTIIVYATVLRWPRFPVQLPLNRQRGWPGKPLGSGNAAVQGKGRFHAEAAFFFFS